MSTPAVEDYKEIAKALEKLRQPPAEAPTKCDGCGQPFSDCACWYGCD